MARIFSAFLLACAALLGGCVSTANVAVAPQRLAQARGASFAVTERPRADFAAMTASKMGLGGLGGAVGGAIAGVSAVKAGNELIRERDIPDPAVRIGQELSTHLGSAFGLTVTSGTVAVAVSDVAELAAAAAGRSDYLLDVQTVNWSCIYLPLHWTKYKVLYTVKLRLIDVKKRDLVAEGFFAWETPKGDPNPTYDELFADNGRLFREQLAAATAAAIAHFRENVLKP